MSEKLKSRKLGAFVILVVTALVTAYTGEITWAKAVSAILYGSIAYVGAQGVVDYGEKRA